MFMATSAHLPLSTQLCKHAPSDGAIETRRPRVRKPHSRGSLINYGPLSMVLLAKQALYSTNNQNIMMALT
jgi:hypothetical protein